MLKKWLVVFGLFALPLAAQDLVLQHQQTVVTLGNSITEMGEEPCGYVTVMRKALAMLYPERRIYFVNAGISGSKSTAMAARFERDVLQYQPDWVTISVGVNDVWHGFLARERQRTDLASVPLPVYKEKVTEMITAAQARGIRVALFTATVIKEDLNSPENRALAPYNQALRDLANKFKCLLMDQDAACRAVLLPLQKEGMSDRGILTSDGVHMLPAGNWLMAQTALTAWGVPLQRLQEARPLIEAALHAEKSSWDMSLARYAEVNYEVGLPRPEEKRIIMIGSSAVDMWNFASDFKGVSLLNRGIGGETSDQFWLRFRPDVLHLKPYGVIIYAGTCNDFWSENRMSPSETKANLARMARMASAQDVRVAIGAIAPVNDYLPNTESYIISHPINEVLAINRWLKALCEENGYDYIDFYTPVADEAGKMKKEWSSDGIHCNARGYAAWTALVEEVLTRWGVTHQ